MSVLFFLFLICFWIFVLIFYWENNEVKCTIIKTENTNAADDYEQTLNCT